MRQILLYLFILFACSVSAEPLKITGRVIDVDGFNNQVIGASVQVCGTHRGTSTDGDGKFSIEVEKGAILKFSCIGFYDKYVEVLNDSSLVIEMKQWIEFCFCPHRHVILPDNYLKSSLQEIKRVYPDLIQRKDGSYKRESSDMCFSLYNGIVYKQYYSLKYKDIKLEELYDDIAWYLRKNSSDERKSGKATTLYYPEYSVHIQYVPHKHVSITYELNPEYYK
ncbi:MAG: carboxypeptidase-like regulatory domain-containing protein [Muribaculaceae bacterium]|nr:carboxypeptidase-like regulatory domain-containing protein [Muribaculaceae bacterium]